MDTDQLIHVDGFRTEGSRTRALRVVAFESSHLESFCGVQAFADSLAANLLQGGTSVQPVDIEDASLLKLGTLLRVVAQKRPDVVSLQYPTETFGRGLLAHLFSLTQRVAPLVITVHEFSQLHLLRRVAMMLLFWRASMVISTTRVERARMERWNPWLKGRTRVISIANIMPARDWNPEDPPLVVYLGQIRPEKGLDDFFACFDRLSGVRFAIIGSAVPKFSSYHETISEQAKRRGIPMLSGMTDDQVSDQLAKATVALLPFPDGATFRRSSLLAAAGCGVPIATRIGPDTPSNMADLLKPARTTDHLVDLVTSFLVSSSEREEAHLQSVELSRLAGWEPITREYLDAFEAVTR